MLGFYIVAAVIGMGVAAGELVSRYRDEPFRALLSTPASFYLAVNAGASLAALAVARAFDWQFGVTGSPDDADVRWTQTLVAGFGAIALFRTSLFIVRVADQDVGMGPSTFLTNILGAADRAIDRRRGDQRSRFVGEVLSGIDFEKAYESLPAYALGVLQNVPSDTQAQLGRQVDALRASSMPDSARVLLLGLLLMNVVGEDVLRSAVAALGDSIKT